MIFLPTKAGLNVILHYIICYQRILKVHEFNTKLNFECQKHNAMIVDLLLKTNDLSLCLNREYFKCMLRKPFFE